jgi:ketosteroid isomerase-like protein
MSEENVEIVRQLVEAWNQRDRERTLSYLADEVEWSPAGPAAVERTVYRGRDEVSEGFDSTWETWRQFHFDEDETRDLGDSVLWLGRVQMTGGASHIELDQEFALHCTLSNAKIARINAFRAWRDALEAAGLPESGG